MPGDWYVLQTMTGQEMKAKESVDKRLEVEEMESFILETLVPMERVTEVKVGKKTTTNRKLFPGYILMNLMLYDDTRNIHERVWTFIHDTPGIIGFIGSVGLALGYPLFTAWLREESEPSTAS